MVSLISPSCSNTACLAPQWESVSIKYDTVYGIGYESTCTRRDPSDVIKAGDTWYIYYTKVFGRAAGYWGTIWAAKSQDAGYTWTEIGEVLGVGESGSWDAQATFTPNIIKHQKKYYLFYTAVQPTPGRADGAFENNSVNDYTAIGIAVSEHPEGPFTRFDKNPVLSVSEDQNQFDSYRVDDAVLLFREGQFWLYYKGRSATHGPQGPGKTKMGVAFASHPTGPFTKYGGNPILDKSHEVLTWPQGPGVACLASISSSLEYAPDGLDFISNPLSLSISNRPNAPGLFRPDLSQPTACGEIPAWGISMIHNGPECYLQRFEFILSLQD